MEQKPKHIPDSDELLSGLRKVGWIFLALGIVSVVWPSIATIALEQFIAWLFIFSGTSGLLFWIRFRSHGASIAGLATAAMALILGVIFVFEPIVGARTLTLILAALFMVEGVLGIAIALSMRPRFPGWTWSMLSAASTLILSVLIFAGWPEATVWIIGFLFGLNLLTTGAALLALGGLGKSR